MAFDLANTVGSLRSNPHLLDVATRPLLTPEECAEVRAVLDDEWKPMRVVAAPSVPGEEPTHGGLLNEQARRGHQQPLPGGDTGPLAARITQTVVQVNEEIFRFRVVGMEANVQVLRYDGETEDRFVPHTDIGPLNSMRKLSFSLLLSDPAEFTGGDLCFGDPIAAARVQGTIAIFPSYLTHQVTPVTGGTRDVVVGWMVGPAFS
ncbi:MAG: 2OG-Fe(II) oxygenase [Acidimicrobiia bacterium]